MTAKKLSKIDLGPYLENSDWDHGNRILYNLCTENFSHKNRESVLTKVLFIGRIYAAAIERRKIKNSKDNNSFYTKKIWPAFQNSDIDRYLEELKTFDTMNQEKLISKALLLHGYLMRRIRRITELDKRSFVSKYLHFHLPNVFFLYDGRASKGLSRF